MLLTFVLLVRAGAAHGAAGPIITEFSVQPNPSPSSITAGPDGNLWLILSATQVGVMTTAGKLIDTISLPQPPPTFFPPFLGNFDSVNNIVTGPDGNLWFCEGLTPKIGRLTPDGDITEFPVPSTSDATSSPGGITAGPDGALWFTDAGARSIGRITTDGQMQMYPLGHNHSPISIT
ncbi:MAG TPA: hypothetical protein VGE98_02850, partial [Thermoanaerobaculia bacterium]